MRTRKPKLNSLKKRSRVFRVRILARSPANPKGVLEMGSLRFPCALGRGGRSARKREGDGATPQGVWPMRELLYRSDKGQRPLTALPVRPIRRQDGWCDAPLDRNYNRPVRLPYSASAESMARTDHLYDFVIVLGYNDNPRRAFGGSAIFVHLARGDFSPTEGCIALPRAAFLKIAARLKPGSVVDIGATPRPSGRGNAYRWRRGFS
jgi:L,D-peptidoglycan transpeptidase YkuD (ErfK/YbiS/YcfS/YnhG family)